MTEQLGDGTIHSMGPSSAPDEGWNGLGQVGIPTGPQGDHSLDTSALCPGCAYRLR
jgi:hypothetical protein